MKSRGIKGGILAGIFSVVSLCSVLAQDSNSNYGIVAKEKYNCKAANIADYKHAHFSKSTCDEGGLVINMSTRNVLVNENYKQQVGAPTETSVRLPMAREKRVPDSVSREANYKDQASM